MPKKLNIAVRNTTQKNLTTIRLATGFVIFVCITLIAMEAWFALGNREIELKGAKTDVFNLTQALTQHAEDTFKKADTALFGLSQRIEAGGMRPQELRELYPFLVAQVAELPELQGIFIFNEHGKWMLNSMSDVPGDFNDAHLAYFTHHRDNRQRDAFIGPALRSSLSGDWVITVSRRLNHPDGSFAGVILASIKMEYFNNYYASFSIGKSGGILMMLADSTVLIRSPFTESLIGASMADSELYRTGIKFRKSDTVNMHSAIDGVKRLMSYRHLDHYPLILVSAVSEHETLQSWRDQTYLQASGVLLLSGLIALLGLRLIKQIGIREAMASELTLAQQRVLAANKTLQRLALQDGMTGLANRRQFDLTLVSEYDRSVREQRAIAMLMIDVDFFKRYNDTYGHPQGDSCLRKVAGVMQTQRPGDFAARYGGEEFALILAETDLKGAMIVAETIRVGVRKLNIVHSGNPTGFVTVSIGVTSTIPSSFDNGPPAFLQTADEALYSAKNSGRDKVCALIPGRKS